MSSFYRQYNSSSAAFYRKAHTLMVSNRISFYPISSTYVFHRIETFALHTEFIWRQAEELSSIFLFYLSHKGYLLTVICDDDEIYFLWTSQFFVWSAEKFLSPLKVDILYFLRKFDLLRNWITLAIQINLDSANTLLWQRKKLE